MVRVTGMIGVAGLLFAGCAAHTEQLAPDAATETSPNAVAAAGDRPVRPSESAQPPIPSPPEAATMPVLSQTPSAFGESDIRGVVEAGNDRQIEQSRIALKRARNPEVKAFAKLMLEQYEALKSKTAEATRSAPSTECELSRSWRMGTAVSVETLAAKSDAEFDRAYIALVVSDHDTALQTLTRKLIPTVQTAELGALMEGDLKPVLEDSLRRASVLLKNLEASGPSRGDAASGT